MKTSDVLYNFFMNPITPIGFSISNLILVFILTVWILEAYRKYKEKKDLTLFFFMFIPLTLLGYTLFLSFNQL